MTTHEPLGPADYSRTPRFAGPPTFGLLQTDSIMRPPSPSSAASASDRAALREA